MRIACLLDRDFEDAEFRKPDEALRSAGHEVVVSDLDAFAKPSLSVLGCSSGARA